MYIFCLFVVSALRLIDHSKQGALAIFGIFGRKLFFFHPKLTLAFIFINLKN